MFRISNKYTFLICFLFGLILNSCSYSKTDITLSSLFDSTWDFENTNSYEFDDNLVEIKNGKAQLKALDLNHVGAEFNNGAHVGTFSQANQISVLESSNPNTDLRNIMVNHSSELLAYWRFEDNFNDSSSNAYATTGVGGPLIAQGKIGESLILDGLDDYLSSDLSSLNNEVSFLGWVKFNSFINTHPRIFYNTSFDLYTSTVNQKLGFISGRVGGVADRGLWSTNMAFEAGRWYHVVVTYDKSSNVNDPKVYVDGVLVPITELNAPVGATLSSTTVNVGGLASGLRQLDGSLDEVAIYSRILSQEEVQSVYQEQSKIFSDHTELSSAWTPKWDNIIGYWKMDGNWQDSSGNGNHGIRNGTGDSSPEFSTNAKIASMSGLFDSADDFVTIPYNAILFSNKLTISAWVKSSATAGSNMVLNNQNGNFYLELKGTSGSICVYINTVASMWNCSTSSINDNTWHMVTATYDGVKTSIYVDGKFENSFTGAGGNIVDAGRNLEIGRRLNPPTDDVAYFLGAIDDLAIWNEPLSNSEIANIYNHQKQKYASYYDSEVIDLGGTTSSWPDLSWSTSLPFGKELIGDFNNDGIPDIESLSDYYGIDGDLSIGLEGLWHFNEPVWDGTVNEVIDQSGNGAHGQNATTIDQKVVGFFGSARYMTNNTNVTIDSLLAPNPNDTMTFQTWVNASDPSVGFNRLAQKSDGISGWHITRNGGSDQLVIRIDTDMGSNQVIASNSTDVLSGGWRHVVVIIDNGNINLYIDGFLDISTTYNHGSGFGNGTAALNLGRGSGRILDGELDEVAIWSRALTPSEIQQLYRRGANRVKLQLKSCVDSSCNCKSYGAGGDATDCDGDTILNTVDTDDIHKSEFIGPGGDGTTYFSELYNRQGTDISFQCALNTTDDNIGICVPDEISFTGSSKPTGPEFLNIDYAQFVNPLANRYAQYRVYMEADDNKACGGEPCLPELSSVSLNPSGAIKYASDYVEVKPASSINFTKLIDAKIKASACARFRLARGASQYYHDGTQWEPVTLTTQNNTAQQVTSNILQFGTQHGAGSLQVVGYLKSDVSGASQCTIDEIDINFQ